MKKNERLSDLIGKCDDKFIDLAENNVTPVAKRRISIMPFAAAAACICLVGGGLFIYSRSNDLKGGSSEAAQSEGELLSSEAIGGMESTDDTIAEIAPENDIAIIPQWDEMPYYSQFPCFEFGGIAYSTAGPTLDTVIGERLGSAASNNVDIYTNTNYNTELEIFAINNVDSDYAVAVKCPDNTYAVYTNCNYETATLGDLIEGLSLDENMRFDALYMTTQDEMTALRFMLDLNNVDTSCIWEFLKSCDNAESMGDYIEFSDSVFRENSDILDGHIDFAVYSDVLGFGNLSFSFTKGGYITTNVISTGRAFYIGIDKVNELVSILNEQGFEIGENATLSTDIPTIDDADLTEAELWDSLAGYWNGENGRFCLFEAESFATAFWESEWGDDNGNVDKLDFSSSNKLTATIERIVSSSEYDEVVLTYVIIDYSKLNSDKTIYVTYNGENLGAFTFAGKTMDDAFAAYAGTNTGEGSTSMTLGYNPPTENTEVYLIAEFAQLMGKEPIALTQDEAASILQKISSLVLTPALAESIDFPTGGGYIINVEGDRQQSFNIIGEDILCIDGENYYLIESDTTGLIDEIVALLGAQDTESDDSQDVTVDAYQFGDFDARLAELDLIIADDIPDDILSNARTAVVMKRPDENTSEYIKYEFFEGNIVRINDQFYRDLSGKADILRQDILDWINNPNNRVHLTETS